MSPKEAVVRGITASRTRAGAQKTVRQRSKAGSTLEQSFAAQIERAGLAAVRREFRFAPPRLWRFDFAWPELLVAVEIEGGVWTGGGHNRGAGYVKNLEKYNAAAALGWRLFRFHEGTVIDGSAIKMVAPFVRAATYSPGII